MNKLKAFASKLFLKYLQILTRSYVKRQNIDVFGLTGTAGKTTLTIALYEVLSKKYKSGMTYTQGKGLNSETGIPFAMLGVKVDGYSIADWVRYFFEFTWNFFFKKCPYEKYVIEMGVDKPGDMDFILSMTKVDLGIFLTIGKVHAANFEKLLESKFKDKELAELKEKVDDVLMELIFEEKAKLIRKLDSDGWAVLNYDEPIIRNLEKVTKAKTITFGLSKDADISGVITKNTPSVFEAEVSYKGKSEKIEITKYFINENVLRTLLAAIAVGITYEIPLKKCISAIEGMNFPPGRMTKIEGIKDTVIIDSSYNASTQAVIEALNNLALFKKREKIAILGDMRELGRAEKREHEEVARHAANRTDKLIVIGPAMKKYFLPEVIKQGFDVSSIWHFDNTWKALRFIQEKVIKGGEAILIKGSQNTLFLEIIVEGLMKDKAKVEDILCRRGSFWEKKRRQLKIKN
ncbi:hypothetical protein JW766_06565 [Candidatus Dojkabacteria bacterium]|nr:hypothetical protein [Candidatus Dojkabacteria bacterium]